MSSRTAVNIRMQENVAIVGSISSRMAFHIYFGSMSDRYVLRNVAIATSSNEIMSAKSAPDIIPGRIGGNVILKKVINGLVPKFIAAYSRFLSTTRSEADAVTSEIGIAIFKKTTTLLYCRFQLRQTLSINFQSIQFGLNFKSFRVLCENRYKINPF